MADKLPFFAAESGTWRTTSPDPHIDLSGTALTLADYQALSALAERHDLWLVVDEVYSHFRFDGQDVRAWAHGPAGLREVSDDAVLAGRVSDANQSQRALGLSVLVEAGRGLELGVIVDRPAGDVPKQRIERRSADLAAVLQVEIGLILLDIGESLVPVGLLKPVE
jgi:hypothetical protein